MRALRICYFCKRGMLFIVRLKTTTKTITITKTSYMINHNLYDISYISNTTRKRFMFLINNQIIP
ncbi:hypothetical protein VSA01S_22070 [Vibrio sagamiensis NBRC 104589]|uniref:Uncharacterized protein n=1 Tax=Vibrio sagamiensis NBRC 104589 TaxID=1219064 RepID=A0A511QFL6_9VIBR|nr:hypothetical protein VSA01S_22070 [Vibrio sagamiensis NBRC 104589]